MNIFFLDEQPNRSASNMADRHVIKMILESAQMLSTAHRILDGREYLEVKNNRQIKRWRLDDTEKEALFYKATHVNHPSAVWSRENSANYKWLYRHYFHLLREYTLRYNKFHKCSELLLPLFDAPKNIVHSDHISIPPCAMDDEFKLVIHPTSMNDVVANYRNYYLHGKRHLHTWKTEVPEFITKGYENG